MASSIVIVVESIGATDNGDQIEYTCRARCGGMDVQDATLLFYAYTSPDALAATVNAAIKEAGIDAAGVAGFTVGVLDKKTLVGAAVGL